jgi:uncharacterized repeat protein (TIGR01451 family)
MDLIYSNKFCTGRKPRLLALKLTCAVIFLVLMGTAGVALGYQPDLMGRLASQEGAYVGEGILEPGVVTQTTSQPVFPGRTAEYRIVVKNLGSQPDRYLLKGSWNENGLSVRYLDEGGVDRGSILFGAGYSTAIVAPGATVSFLLQVTPAQPLPGASYRVTLSATSLTVPDKVDQIKAETVACAQTAAVTVSTPPDAWGFPGSLVTYPYTVTNVGNTEENFNLSFSRSTSWPTAIYADDGAGGGIAGDGVRQAGESRETVSTGVLPPGASYRFFIAVTIPSDSVDRSRADTRLSVFSEAARAGDEVTTSAISALLTLAESVRNLSRGGPFAPVTEALPGDTLEYRMSLTNSGSTGATGVAIDVPLPGNTGYLPGTLWVGTSASGDGPPCAAADCGFARESGGNLIARLGQGATDAAGGTLAPGKTLHLFFRVQVE